MRYRWLANAAYAFELLLKQSILPSPPPPPSPLPIVGHSPMISQRWWSIVCDHAAVLTALATVPVR